MPANVALAAELAALAARVTSLEASRSIDEAALAALTARLGDDETKINSFLPAAPSATTSGLFFASGFGASVALSSPSNFYGTGAWQGISGTDSLTGFTWPPKIGVDTTTQFFLLIGANVDPATIGNYMLNQIQTLTGHKGTQTQVLSNTILQSGGGANPTQNTFMIQPVAEPGDLYISYWLKLQPNLPTLMEVGPIGAGGWHWRSVFEIKTAGDFRFILMIRRDPYINGGNLYWNFIYDNNANGGLPYQQFWSENNIAVAVPVNQWMKVETFWHRSGANDGRWWMALNGQVLVDHYGPNIGVNKAAIDRIMPSLLYSSTAYPIYQWMDDLEIWDGFPPASGTNPPYAPH